MADLVVGDNRATLETIGSDWDTANGGGAGRRPQNPSGARVNGSSTHTGNASATTFTVTHGAGFTPSKVNLTPTTAAAGAAHHVSSKTATTFVITFASAPAAAADNVKFDWEVVK